MKQQFGFGMIEVVLAFIIVTVTAGTLLQLNKIYLEYSRDGRYREVALRMSESKLDELRSFNSAFEYQAIDSGSELIAMPDGMEYDISWDVTDQVDKKLVVVTVSWQGAYSVDSFSLESVIVPNLSITNGPFGAGGNQTDGGGVDVMGGADGDTSIDLGDGYTQETSQPYPKVTKQGNSESTRVSFSTYVLDYDNVRQSEQDVVSVSCNCNLTDEGEGNLPAERVAMSGFSYWVRGGWVGKLKGTPAIHQDPLCDRCCTHHFDGSLDEFIHWYDVFKWSVENNPHKHYSGGPSPASWIQASVTGNSYWEACRLVRINGLYEVAGDWNLVAINIFDAALFLNSHFKQTYQDYVKMVAQEYIRSQVKDGDGFNAASYYSPIDFSNYLSEQGIEPGNTDLEINPGPRQLMARGIYVDMVSPDYRTALLNGVMGGDADETPDNLLRYVPFYEVNLTLLASWQPTDNTVASVSSEPVQTAVDSSQNYYGVYSRGLVDGKQAGGPVTITATIRRGNSGITAFRPLSAFEESDVLSSQLQVTVLNTDEQSSVSGQIKCITYRVTGPNTKEEKCSDTQFGNIRVSINGSQCGKTTAGQGGNQTISYVCYVDPDTSATLTANVPSDAGYVVIPPPPAPAETNTWTVEVPGEDPTSVSGGCLLVVVNKPESVASPASCET